MTLSSLTAQPKRFTVREYHQLVELGFFSEDDHIELIRDNRSSTYGNPRYGLSGR